MKEKICCVYDSSESYAIRLAEAMNSCEDVPYKVMAFTDEAAIYECSNRYDIEVLLAEESIDGEIISKIKPEYAYMLSEDSTDIENHIIFKYQSVDRIIKTFMAGLTDNGYVKNSTTVLTCVYSPAGDEITTLLGLGYAYNRAKKEKILYLNFNEFGGLSSFFANGNNDLSDAFYYYLSSDDKKISKIMECISSQYGMDYIKPFSCPEDVKEITVEHILSFIESIANSGIYSEIVIEVSGLISNHWQLMNECERVLVPEVSTRLSQEKMNEFYLYIEKCKYRNVKKIIKIVNLNYYRTMDINLELLDSLYEVLHG